MIMMLAEVGLEATTFQLWAKHADHKTNQTLPLPNSLILSLLPWLYQSMADRLRRVSYVGTMVTFMYNFSFTKNFDQKINNNSYYF